MEEHIEAGKEKKEIKAQDLSDALAKAGLNKVIASLGLPKSDLPKDKGYVPTPEEGWVILNNLNLKKNKASL